MLFIDKFERSWYSFNIDVYLQSVRRFLLNSTSFMRSPQGNALLDIEARGLLHLNANINNDSFSKDSMIELVLKGSNFDQDEDIHSVEVIERYTILYVKSYWSKILHVLRGDIILEYSKLRNPSWVPTYLLFSKEFEDVFMKMLDAILKGNREIFYKEIYSKFMYNISSKADLVGNIINYKESILANIRKDLLLWDKAIIKGQSVNNSKIMKRKVKPKSIWKRILGVDEFVYQVEPTTGLDSNFRKMLHDELFSFLNGRTIVKSKNFSYQNLTYLLFSVEKVIGIYVKELIKISQIMSQNKEEYDDVFSVFMKYLNYGLKSFKEASVRDLFVMSLFYGSEFLTVGKLHMYTLSERSDTRKYTSYSFELCCSFPLNLLYYFIDMHRSGEASVNDMKELLFLYVDVLEVFNSNFYEEYISKSLSILREQGGRSLDELVILLESFREKRNFILSQGNGMDEVKVFCDKLKVDVLAWLKDYYK